jgi:hypothetical protein
MRVRKVFEAAVVSGALVLASSAGARAPSFRPTRKVSLVVGAPQFKLRFSTPHMAQTTYGQGQD